MSLMGQLFSAIFFKHDRAVGRVYFLKKRAVQHLAITKKVCMAIKTVSQRIAEKHVPVRFALLTGKDNRVVKLPKLKMIDCPRQAKKYFLEQSADYDCALDSWPVLFAKRTKVEKQRQ